MGVKISPNKNVRTAIHKENRKLMIVKPTTVNDNLFTHFFLFFNKNIYPRQKILCLEIKYKIYVDILYFHIECYCIKKLIIIIKIILS